jgi:hypothetical protein
MTYTTRKPTGKTPWPILLLAGVEKAGKTYAAAEASASDLIGETYWITVGEDQPDEYGPLGDFNIVEHDGTYRGILGAVQWAASQPAGDKPNLIVLDSAGRVWNLLTDQAQETANERARRKGNAATDGAPIAMDLWNIAKQRWNHILDALRDHNGPVILTARLDLVTVMDGDKPTKEKQWKVQAEKNLPFEVGAIVQLRSFGDAYLTGVRSLRFRPKPNEYTPLPEFTVDGLWRHLGLGEGGTGREHATNVPQGENAERAAILAQIKEAAEKAKVDLAAVAAEWAESHNGEAIKDATDLGSLELFRDDLIGRAA